MIRTKVHHQAFLQRGSSFKAPEDLILMRPLHLKNEKLQAGSGVQGVKQMLQKACVELSDCQAVGRANARLSVSFSLMQLHPDSGGNLLQARRQAQARVARRKTSIFHWAVFPESTTPSLKMSHRCRLRETVHSRGTE